MNDDTRKTGDKISRNDLLGTAYKLRALSKVVADWLCNNSTYGENGEHDPNSGDMVTISSMLTGECIALVELLENPDLEVKP